MADIDLDQLAQRESEQIEWKENVADVDDVVATLCAFANDLANLGGGYVVCGAREAKDDHGFPILLRTGLSAERFREIENRTLARCRDRVSPPLAPLISELAAETPDRRILVFIQPATPSAHTARRGSEGAKHFVRIGRSTIEARNGVLRDLLVRKGALESWDRRPCESATERDLDLLALRDALNQMGLGLSDARVEQFLAEDSSLSPFVPSLCVREKLTNVLRPRNFALLLFGRNVQRFIPGAFSLFSIYPGIDRADRHADRHEIAGSLIEQGRRLRPLLDAQAHTVFDKADPHTPNAVKYPQRALYEAMGNALAHRDYERPDPVRITAFADRIEFLSPGSLPAGVDPEAFRQGSAAPKWRNQALAWFFNRLQLAQAEGQGIPTILRTMRDEGCPPPTFRTAADSVACVLPAHPRHIAGYAVAEAQRAISHRGDSRRAVEAVDFLLQQLGQPERAALIDPEELLELAYAIARSETTSQALHEQAKSLIRATEQRLLDDRDVAQISNVLRMLGDTDALIAFTRRHVATAPPRHAADLLAAGDMMLSEATAVANSARDPRATPDERAMSLRRFRSAATEARRLFSGAVSIAKTASFKAKAERALALIAHLEGQTGTTGDPCEPTGG